MSRRDPRGAGIVIRAARPDDAPAIARVQIETWRAAYRGIVWDATLAGLSPTDRARSWGETLGNQRTDRFLLVAEDVRDGVTGFVSAGPERSGDPIYRGEIYAIYVLPSHQRNGAGRALLRAATERLIGAGTTSMLLWVLEANAPARRFYEALGGTVIRSKPIDIARQTLPEVAYGWPDLRRLMAVGEA